MDRPGPRHYQNEGLQVDSARAEPNAADSTATAGQACGEDIGIPGKPLQAFHQAVKTSGNAFASAYASPGSRNNPRPGSYRLAKKTGGAPPGGPWWTATCLGQGGRAALLEAAI